MRALALMMSASILAACGAQSRSAVPADDGDGAVNAEPETPRRPDVMGTQGAVVAGHPLAAAAGHDVLRRGGNAVDAAVTMAAVLAVVRPHMNGVGGDGFALIYDAEAERVAALNGSGRAAAAATPEFFAAQGLDDIPGSGPLAVTVPGAVSAWAAALDRYGTISFADALEPAIRYAEQGFPVSWRLERDVADAVEDLNEAGQAIYAPGGELLRAGALLRNPALAGTLRALAAEGPSALYGGSIGRSLAEFLGAQGSPLRPEDFAAHTPTWTDPVSVPWHGLRVHTMPPNSQGFALLQQLVMAEEFPLAELGHNSAEYLHTLVELKKLAFADRDRWVADPATAPAPLERLLAPDYLRERAALVTERAAEQVAPGLGGATDVVAAAGDGDTVYLMAVDQWGNAVSWIQSLFSTFGSKLVEPSTGIVLQNRGAGFTLDEGHPNRIAGGKRPFHTLTPVMLTDGSGQFEMTIGTPGGHGQTQTHTQILHAMYLFGLSPQQAVEAARFRHFDGLSLGVEERIPADVLNALAERGHDLRVISGWTSTFGGAQVIRVVQRSPMVLRTGADPRREAYAVAY